MVVASENQVQSGQGALPLEVGISISRATVLGALFTYDRLFFRSAAVEKDHVYKTRHVRTFILVG